MARAVVDRPSTSVVMVVKEVEEAEAATTFVEESVTVSKVVVAVEEVPGGDEDGGRLAELELGDAEVVVELDGCVVEDWAAVEDWDFVLSEAREEALLCIALEELGRTAEAEPEPETAL